MVGINPVNIMNNSLIEYNLSTLLMSLGAIDRFDMSGTFLKVTA